MMYNYLFREYRYVLLLGFFLLFHFGALAQGLTVQGTVTDEGRNPLPGVTIVLKGTTSGVATDAAGKTPPAGLRPRVRDHHDYPSHSGCLARRVTCPCGSPETRARGEASCVGPVPGSGA